MRTEKGIRVAVAVVLAALVVCGWAGPSAANGPAKTKTVEGTFVGAAQGSPAYVAVYADKPDKKGRRKVVAYVCDSQQLAEWFNNKDVKGNTLSLTSDDGARLKATLTKSAAKGTITLADGTKLSFAAPLANEPAGLYRAEQTIAGQDYLGGWILLPDGTQRGAVKRAQQVIANPFIDPNSAPNVPLPGIGTLTPELQRD
jgi:hypothetical protein